MCTTPIHLVYPLALSTPTDWFILCQAVVEWASAGTSIHSLYHNNIFILQEIFKDFERNYMDMIGHMLESIQNQYPTLDYSVCMTQCAYYSPRVCNSCVSHVHGFQLSFP